MLPGIDINGWEFIILIVVSVVVLGPDKLPEYAQKLAQWVKQLRGYAEGARSSLREQMGPEFDDIDWKAYDPRQYDPRRIVREALMDDSGPDDLFGRDDAGLDAAPVPAMSAGSLGSVRHDPTHTPWDVDAT